MDFLSLFDPSDGTQKQNSSKKRHKDTASQDTVKKKQEGTTKGEILDKDTASLDTVKKNQEGTTKGEILDKDTVSQDTVKKKQEGTTKGEILDKDTASLDTVKKNQEGTTKGEILDKDTVSQDTVKKKQEGTTKGVILDKDTVSQDTVKKKQEGTTKGVILDKDTVSQDTVKKKQEGTTKGEILDEDTASLDTVKKNQEGTTKGEILDKDTVSQDTVKKKQEGTTKGVILDKDTVSQDTVKKKQEGTTKGVILDKDTVSQDTVKKKQEGTTKGEILDKDTVSQDTVKKNQEGTTKGEILDKDTASHDTVKKKQEGTIKGRRRGRKSNGKNETLPEESSFLCEPDLSTEILVKDVSYIDNFIEINKKDDDTKSDEKKPKRRNSSRKSRRRKKQSPAKDSETTDTKNNLNNKLFKPKTEIGKNVNDLKKEAKKKEDFKEYKFDSKSGVYKDRSVYNVIDKLEKVSLKDDMYLAGDFNTEDLESDFFYCSDDDDEYCDDSTSDDDDSSDEVYGSLPPEPRFGNVEYKLRLSSLCERRFQHLVTQLKWRLISGGGSCVYVVGVRDCGALRGLSARALRGSLCALRRMARVLPAAVTHVTARRVAEHRAVAEVIIKKIADPQQSVELRIAVMGANEAGKSTLIGVLTQGELDNGTGSARLNMFRHQHEVKTGRTSSLSHEILGFDAQGNVVNYGCSELMTAERIGARSAKLVAFLDLAGHSKYQRTTRLGLTGYSPHYAMLCISATAGITPITEEHMGLLLALKLPFFVVINKCELAAGAVKLLVARLEAMLETHDKKPVLITDENLARNCCAPQKSILDSIDKDNNNDVEEDVKATVPVFPVSCVRGCGLAALHAYLLALQPPPLTEDTQPDQETCEFQIDEIFHVGDSTGPVVGGLLTRGQLYEGDKLLIGPLEDGSFEIVSVRSVYRNRVPHGLARAGQPASLSLHTPCPQVRPGMVLLAIPEGYKQGSRPTWGGCTSYCKRKMEISEEIIKLKQSPIQKKNKNRKHNKHKNLIQNIIEDQLTKKIGSDDKNIYKNDDSDDDKKVYDKNDDSNNDKTVFNDDSDNDKQVINDDKQLIDRRKAYAGSIDDKNVYNDDSTDDKNLSDDSTDDKIVYNDDLSDKELKDDIKVYDDVKMDDTECICDDRILLEDPTDPRGCLFFQASVHVLRHSTAIYPGFQCTVHVGNVRQTAIIEGIMSRNNLLRAGESASVLFRFVRCPEYLVRGRQLLFTAGLGTRGTGRITQIFPFVP